MLLDKEENHINLSYKPNGHTLVLGSSGQGKTYYCCRRLEEEIKKGKRILMCDFSGSYREDELRKSDFVNRQEVQVYNPCIESCNFPIRIKDKKKLARIIAKVIANVLAISSYKQGGMLNQTLEAYLNVHEIFSFYDFFRFLDYLYSREQKKKGGYAECEKISKLLDHLAPYSDIEFVKIAPTEIRQKSPITLIQLSDFPEQQRIFLANFLLGVLWEEAMTGIGSGYDAIFLDEFQHLSMSKNGGLSKLLREGRKFQISLVLSSQFIGNYDMAEQEIILQAGSKVLFKPVARDLRAYVEIVGGSHKKDWLGIFESMQIGEAVVVGNYTVGRGTEICQTPILCEIKKDAEKKPGPQIDSFRARIRRYPYILSGR